MKTSRSTLFSHVLAQLWLVLCATLAMGTAQAAKVAIVDLAGADFGHGNGVDLNSSPTTLDAQSRYYYRLEGTIHGTGLFSLVIPSGTDIADLLEDIEPGSSSNLVGFYDNAGGGLPFTFINEQYSGEVTTAIGSVLASLDLVGSVDAGGIVRVEVKNVSITLGGSPVAGTVVFEAGSKATIGVPPILQFNSATATVAEDGGSVQLTVARSANSSGAHMVHYATANGTAQAGTHYTATSGDLNFGDGVDSGTITVNIADNGATNADRTFTVTLSAPTLGAELGAQASITVTITDNDSAGPAPFIKASFTGLGGGSNYGFIHFNTTARGKITGSIFADGLKYSFKGQLDATGMFTKNFPAPSVPRGAPSLAIQVAMNNASFTGSLFGAAFTGERDESGTKDEPVDQAGNYTALLGVSNLTAGGGPLSGFLSLKVSPTGSAKFKGALPDGTSVKGTSFVSITGKLPVAVGLYKKKAGFLAGQTTLAQTDLLRWAGPLTWTKPAGSKGLYGEAGLTNVAVALAGVPFVAPAKGVRVLADLDTANGAAVVRLDKGNLPATLDKNVTIDTKNKVAVDAPGDDKLKVEIVSKKGAFSGDFLDGDTKRKFKGVFIQDSAGSQLGAGFFLGTDVAGSVVIDP